ncbi:DUF6701 domain-containing protein [Vibrio rotiferianus]|uniref:DUF6701 domain-containing protein n=1 Tax=Vibrio rotiferianus TaxID=190895 RepID=UPI00390B6B98
MCRICKLLLIFIAAFPKLSIASAIDTTSVFPDLVQGWPGSQIEVNNVNFGSSGDVALGFSSVKLNGWAPYKIEADKSKMIEEPDVVDMSYGEVEFKPGWSTSAIEVPTGSYKKVHLSSGSGFEFTGDTYSIGELIIEAGAHVVFSKATVIKANKVVIQGGVHIETFGDCPDNLIFWLEDNKGQKAEFSLLTNLHLIADIFSRSSVKIEYGTVEGSISAKKVHLNGTTFKRSDHCAPSPSQNVDSIVIKANNYHLACEDAVVEVHTLDRDKMPVNGMRPNLTSNDSSLIVDFQNEINGVSYFKVENLNNEIGNFSLHAELVSESGSYLMDNAQIKFSPYKFSIKSSDSDSWHKQTFPAIAGRESSIDIKVIGCKGDETVLAKYNKKLTNDNFEILTRRYGTEGSIFVNTSNFTQGLSRENSIVYDNSGEVDIRVSDRSFNCDDIFDDEVCVIDNRVLSGEFSISARPFKVAICDVKSHDVGNPATTVNGVGFISSSTPFQLKYKPVIYDSDSSNICNNKAATNYVGDSATFEVTSKVAYPTNGDLGSFLPVESISFGDSENKNSYTKTYTWNEVGTLEIVTNATYLGMELDAGVATVGRFYPDYFRVLEYEWINHDGQTFTYMGQTFKNVSSKITAFNNLGGAVLNYELFDYANRASFSLFDESNRVSNGDAASLAKHSYFKGASWILNAPDISWEKKNSFEPDGPYNFPGSSELNIKFQIHPSLNGDPAVFKSFYDDVGTNLSKATTKGALPKLLFGRAKLGDVGGSAGSLISVPMHIEYWNGTRFSTNLKDSFTELTAELFDIEQVWGGESTSNINYIGKARALIGKSNDLKTQQVTEARQQVRLWQDLDSSKNPYPWLKYDWNNDKRNEENPSAVVTYGIYRGSDKVLFRGEPGMY